MNKQQSIKVTENHLYRGKEILIQSELPQAKLANDEIILLLRMVKGCGHDAIMAESKLDKILTLSNDEKIRMAIKTFGQTI